MKRQISQWSATLRIALPALLMLLLGTPCLAADESIELDLRLAPHAKSQGPLAGTLKAVGSESFSHLIRLWAEAFRRTHAETWVWMDPRGSEKAPQALIDGTAQIGVMSHSMKAPELKAFERRHGHAPIDFTVAIGALAIYVNKDNPAPGLTLPQLDAMFSTTRRVGHPQNIERWAQVGVNGSVGPQPIALYGRDEACGLTELFRDDVMQQGTFKKEMHVEAGAASVVQAVTEDVGGIGYSTIGYLTNNVRIVPIAAREGLPFLTPNQQNTMDGSYPLYSQLHLYVNRAADKPWDPLVAEFLRFIFSREGQQLVIKAGFYPITADMADAELKKLQ